MSPLPKPLAPRFERILLIEAFIVLGLTRVGLYFCHFQRIRRLLSLFAVYGRRITRRRISPAALVWAIETAKRKNPLRSTCLTEALTAEALFKQYGHEPVLCIGASVQNGEFAAHAWLENDKAVMVGGPEELIQQFSRFPDFMKVL
jgi:hypothetical protein